MKKVVYGIVTVPVAWCFASGVINLVTGLLAGEINPIVWMTDHRILLVAVLCYILLQFIGPFKKVN